MYSVTWVNQLTHIISIQLLPPRSLPSCRWRTFWLQRFSAFLAWATWTKRWCQIQTARKMSQWFCEAGPQIPLTRSVSTTRPCSAARCPFGTYQRGEPCGMIARQGRNQPKKAQWMRPQLVIHRKIGDLQRILAPQPLPRRQRDAETRFKF